VFYNEELLQFVVFVHAMKTCRGIVGISPFINLNVHLYHVSAALLSKISTDSRRIGGWEGLRFGLDVSEKIKCLAPVGTRTPKSSIPFLTSDLNLINP